MSGFSFNLDKLPPENPTLSVICNNKNHGAYIEDMILSVLSQKFDDFELIIADGGSTDNSLDIIKKYKFITLQPGPDSSPTEGMMKALAAARGRYVMVTTSTDGYLSRDWFKTATSFLDNNPEISLVFGASAMMSATGSLGGISFPNAFPFDKMPQREKMAEVWMFHGISKAYMPELNYCVRMDIFRELCGSNSEFAEINSIESMLRVHFEFNRRGYLPYYLPVLANFGRSHPNQAQFSERNEHDLRVYDAAWKKYRDDVLAGRKKHTLRNGRGETLAEVSIST